MYKTLTIKLWYSVPCLGLTEYFLLVICYLFKCFSHLSVRGFLDLSESKVLVSLYNYRRKYFPALELDPIRLNSFAFGSTFLYCAYNYIVAVWIYGT